LDVHKTVAVILLKSRKKIDFRLWLFRFSDFLSKIKRFNVINKTKTIKKTKT